MSILQLGRVAILLGRVLTRVAVLPDDGGRVNGVVAVAAGLVIAVGIVCGGREVLIVGHIFYAQGIIKPSRDRR